MKKMQSRYKVTNVYPTYASEKEKQEALQRGAQAFYEAMLPAMERLRKDRAEERQT